MYPGYETSNTRVTDLGLHVRGKTVQLVLARFKINNKVVNSVVSVRESSSMTLVNAFGQESALSADTSETLTLGLGDSHPRCK